MVKNEITTQETVDFFNLLLAIDRQAITALFSMRMACNTDLADHETVQVGVEGNYAQVGMIGVLNGLFGKDQHGWGHISADYDNGMIVKFRLLTIEDVKGYVNK